ncbi:MAG: hypothetical protein QXN24_01975 [Candidatus Bathyarchaeia archaeon]
MAPRQTSTNNPIQKVHKQPPTPPFRRGLIPRKRPISDGGWCVILAFIESDLTRDLLNQPAQPRYMLWALEDQDNISGLLRENVRGLRGHLGAIIEALELSDRLTRWLRGGVGWAAGPKPDIRLEDFILGFEPKWRRKPLKPSDTPSMLCVSQYAIQVYMWGLRGNSPRG